jgi:hypothetical protein
MIAWMTERIPCVLDGPFPSDASIFDRMPLSNHHRLGQLLDEVLASHYDDVEMKYSQSKNVFDEMTSCSLSRRIGGEN